VTTSAQATRRFITSFEFSFFRSKTKERFPRFRASKRIFGFPGGEADRKPSPSAAQTQSKPLLPFPAAADAKVQVTRAQQPSSSRLAACPKFWELPGNLLLLLLLLLLLRVMPPTI